MVVVATKFSVKHQGKYSIIDNLQSINDLWVTFLSRPFTLPFPWASQYTVHQCQNWITTVHHWEESFSGGGGGERVYVLMVRAVTGNYASCNPLLQLLPRHNQSCSGWSGAGPRIYATTVSDVSWLEEGLNGCISDFLEIFYKFLVPE